MTSRLLKIVARNTGPPPRSLAGGDNLGQGPAVAVVKEKASRARLYPTGRSYGHLTRPHARCRGRTAASSAAQLRRWADTMDHASTTDVLVRVAM